MSNVQKDRILEGAEELFFKAGIRSVTMDEIARHLGMSKKTIYQFYRDKDDIVSALIQKRLEEDKEQMCGISRKIVQCDGRDDQHDETLRRVFFEGEPDTDPRSAKVLSRGMAVISAILRPMW